MLNYVWGGMILIGIIVAAFTGRMPDITTAAIGAAKDAVQLCLVMLGVVSMWTGLLRIGENAGLIAALARRMYPLLRYLFPDIPKGHPSLASIATNFIANILGLGWAATPAGLEAMQSLQSLNPDKNTASRSMCMFMAVNMSSLQLVTVNVIAYRLQYHSANPTEIIAPGILATVFSTVVSIVVCKLFERWLPG